MKHAQLIAVALGAASLALVFSATPSPAHEAQGMHAPHSPCGDDYDRHMEHEMHHHGMMDESYGPERGRGYGGMFGGPMMAPDEGRGMGPGMMMGPDSMMGSSPRGMRGEWEPTLRSDLSTDEVRHMMEHQLEWMGNPNLKLGKVEESDEGEIVAEIVTQDGSLVQRLHVDKHTGSMRPAN